MIYPIREILHKLAADYGLGKGDLVFTGTPSGVGAIGAGTIWHWSWTAWCAPLSR